MFDQLSERIQGVFGSLRGQKTLNETNIDDALREIRRALLEADVSLPVIKSFISNIKDRAYGEDVLKNVEPGQQMVKIVNDELVALLGGENVSLTFEGRNGNPPIIVLFGLQGSGKTTSAAKLALHLKKKENKTPLLIAADVYRPAAIQQLITLGKQIQVPVHSLEGNNDVQEITKTGMDLAKSNNHDVVIIDTAGRLQVDNEMMAELLLLERTLKPAEKLLVIDAMTGQEAVAVADTFNTQLGVTGIVMTKLDGDARGGAALSVVNVTKQPIKFIGTGEKISGIEPFYPDRMATRILGMGDIVSLVEKAQESIDLEEAQRMEERIRKQSFSLNDFLGIQRKIKMIGSLDQILGMLPIPGVTKDMREMISHGGEEQLKRIEVMISSMTEAERDTPDILENNAGRIARISKGSGHTEEDVRQFLMQFNQMKMMMKQMTNMTDGIKKEEAKRSGGGFLSMPRSKRKKKNKGAGGMGNLGGGFGGGMPSMPGMGGGGMPNLPGLGGDGAPDMSNMSPSDLKKLQEIQKKMKKGKFPGF